MLRQGSRYHIDKVAHKMGPGHISNLVKLKVNVVFLSLCVTGGLGKDKELQNFH